MIQMRFDEATHTYWLGERKVPGVTSILSPLYDFSFIREEVLARKAALGHAVHFACELLDQDDLDWSGISAEALPYIEAYAQFKLDTRFVPHAIERRVLHATHVYAGTLDRTGLIYDDPSLLDLKCVAQLSPATGVQTAAYLEGLKSEGDAFEHPMPQKRYALQLKPNGKYVLKEYREPTDWPTFLALKTIMAWNQRNGVAEK
ncbi:TPA: hypothetical protein QDB28_006405 [Burkholderia vietnamiensis]|nr:hypothetical protein [Burkholderia vietnamiensis]